MLHSIFMNDKKKSDHWTLKLKILDTSNQKKV